MGNLQRASSLLLHGSMEVKTSSPSSSTDASSSPSPFPSHLPPSCCKSNFHYGFALEFILVYHSYTYDDVIYFLYV
jgi:hypothetical protein